jgi:hypothetical protein
MNQTNAEHNVTENEPARFFLFSQGIEMEIRNPAAACFHECMTSLITALHL